MDKIAEQNIDKVAVGLAPKLFRQQTPSESAVAKTKICLKDAMLDIFLKLPEEQQLELVKFQAEVHGIL